MKLRGQECQCRKIRFKVPFQGCKGVLRMWNQVKFLILKNSQIMQKAIVDTADGTKLRRVKAPWWKCAMVKVNFFQEMSSHGVVSDMCDIRNKKLFFSKFDTTSDSIMWHLNQVRRKSSVFLISGQSPVPSGRSNYLFRPIFSNLCAEMDRILECIILKWRHHSTQPWWQYFVLLL